MTSAMVVSPDHRRPEAATDDIPRLIHVQNETTRSFWVALRGVTT